MFIAIMLCLLPGTLGAGAIFDRNYTRPYVLKKTWVQNFVKFQYIFEGKQAKAKIVPLGCVPTNLESGKLLRVGEQHVGHDFVFSCEQTEEGIISYETIACVDGHGQQMQIGETRRMSNGTVVLHCNIHGGALKKIVERAAGCYYNETIFAEDEQWVERIPKNMFGKHRNEESSKKSKTYNKSKDEALTGRLMQCFRPHYSYYESHVIGCVSGRLGVKVGDYGELRKGRFVQCVEDTLGNVVLKNVTLKDLSCSFENNTFVHGQTWIDVEKAAHMSCLFGHVLKDSCIVGNETLPIGQEVKISNGCVFLCHPQTNVYICDDKLGDFNVVEGNDEISLSKLIF